MDPIARITALHASINHLADRIFLDPAHRREVLRFTTELDALRAEIRPPHRDVEAAPEPVASPPRAHRTLVPRRAPAKKK